MDPAEEFLQTIQSRQTPIRKIGALGNSTIQKFYAGKTIFMTGGSGFIGKLLIEKLCRWEFKSYTMLKTGIKLCYERLALSHMVFLFGSLVCVQQ